MPSISTHPDELPGRAQEEYQKSSKDILQSSIISPGTSLAIHRSPPKTFLPNTFTDSEAEEILVQKPNLSVAEFTVPSSSKQIDTEKNKKNQEDGLGQFFSSWLRSRRSRLVLRPINPPIENREEYENIGNGRKIANYRKRKYLQRKKMEHSNMK